MIFSATWVRKQWSWPFSHLCQCTVHAVISLCSMHFLCATTYPCCSALLYSSFSIWTITHLGCVCYSWFMHIICACTVDASARICGCQSACMVASASVRSCAYQRAYSAASASARICACQCACVVASPSAMTCACQSGCNNACTSAGAGWLQ